MKGDNDKVHWKKELKLTGSVRIYGSYNDCKKFLENRLPREINLSDYTYGIIDNGKDIFLEIVRLEKE